MAYRIQLTLVALLVSACGLSVVGTADPDGGTALVDPDAGPTSPPPNCTASACAALDATGFTPVAFGDATNACPKGYDASEVVSDPKADDGSCQCGQCKATGSTCTGGSIQSKYGSTADGCTTSADAVATNGECVVYSGDFVSTYATDVPPAPKLGTCSAPATGVREKVEAQTHRVCRRQASTCAASMCALPGSLRACLAAAGDQVCPANAPEKHLVGADLALACDACTCTPSAVCGGHMDYWSSGNDDCSGQPKVSINANACTKVNGTSIGSLRWVGAVTSETCSDSKPAGPAKPSLTGVQTICCQAT